MRSGGGEEAGGEWEGGGAEAPRCDMGGRRGAERVGWGWERGGMGVGVTHCPMGKKRNRSPQKLPRDVILVAQKMQKTWKICARKLHLAFFAWVQQDGEVDGGQGVHDAEEEVF